MSELTSMKNIGKEMEKKLLAVGITSPEMLNKIGAKKAFKKIKEIYPNVCLVHLYTLQGATENIDFNSLSENTKNELNKFNDTLK